MHFSFTNNAHRKAVNIGFLLLCAFLFLFPFSQSHADLSPDMLPPSVQNGIFERVENPRNSLFSNHSVMLVVPHPDDDINLFGGVFQNYLNAESEIHIVFITNGDFGGKSTGLRRLKEILNAESVCNIPEDHIYFLGYGDQWASARHIYNAPHDAPLISKAKQRFTYGLDSHPAYNDGNRYTRDNLKNDLKGIILSILPDQLYCVDYDGHKDHRATSLFFEETMGEILKEHPDYHPFVAKGFAYSTAWYSEKNFYRENIPSTKNPTGKPYMEENNYFLWSDRIRFPVSTASLSRFAYDTDVHKMLAAHVTQHGNAKDAAILSGDRVFWIRRTDSVLYNADITVSSGKPNVLTDFKVIDSNNVSARENVITDNVWSPGKYDKSKSVHISFAAPQKISRISLYDNPAFDANILNAVITINNKDTFETGPLNANGTATNIDFKETYMVSFLDIGILEFEGNNYGFSEIEAFENSHPDQELKLVKLVDEAEEFIYDYWIQNNDTLSMGLYTLPCSEPLSSFTFDSDGDQETKVNCTGNQYIVFCPKGKSLYVTVKSIGHPDIYDSVKISNPSEGKRLLVKVMQEAEKERFS